jgi:lipoyl(octanoyl) transferase
MKSHGLQAQRRDGAPGVYLNEAKIAALGLRIRRGFSYHGLSFNIDMDLSPYQYVDPCGYKGLQVTQLRDHLAKPASFDQVRDELIACLTSLLESAQLDAGLASTNH